MSKIYTEIVTYNPAFDSIARFSVYEVAGIGSCVITAENAVARHTMTRSSLKPLLFVLENNGCIILHTEDVYLDQGRIINMSRFVEALDDY